MDCVVVVPTFNEVENVGPLLDSIRRVQPELHVLFVDDASPDGTADAVDSLAASDRRVAVLRRNDPRGYAAASTDGFTRALSDGRSVVVTMDCDLSHDPAALEQMLRLIEDGADVVIGSRYVPGGRTVDWPIHRRLLSRWGNSYTAMMLRLPVSDCTSGFRAYRADCLRDLLQAGPTADGYAFLTETLRLLTGTRRWTIRETPITFTDRTRGESKMNLRIVLESMRLVTLWGLRLRTSARAN